MKEEVVSQLDGVMGDGVMVKETIAVRGNRVYVDFRGLRHNPSRPDNGDLALRVRTAKAYFRPNETMLRLADDLLGIAPGLVDLAHSVPVPTQTDPWGPVCIPLLAHDEP